MSKESALHNNNWCTETKLTNIDLANAMDEYAEEVSIDFHKWVWKNYKEIYESNLEDNVEELFKKYKQEKLCNPSQKI